jgi:hypothetical protein
LNLRFAIADCDPVFTRRFSRRAGLQFFLQRRVTAAW